MPNISGSYSQACQNLTYASENGLIDKRSSNSIINLLTDRQKYYDEGSSPVTLDKFRKKILELIS
jgi:hypothetical protein